jgi:hypothetical protein
MMIEWSTCRTDFECDGGLLDIYVHDVTIEQWRTIFDALQANYRLTFSVDNEIRQLPVAVDDAFALRESANPALYFHVGRVLVGCHFVWDEEIEFDIDPAEVTSQQTLDDLLSFIRLIGDTIGCLVTLTHENNEAHPFIAYDPGRKDFDYLPP